MIYTIHTEYPVRTGTRPDNPLWGLSNDESGVFQHLNACPKCEADLTAIRVLLHNAECSPGATLAPFEWATSIPCGCTWSPPEGRLVELQETWRIAADGSPIRMPGVMAFLRPPFVYEEAGSLVTVPGPSKDAMGMRFGISWAPFPELPIVCCAADPAEPEPESERSYRWWAWWRR